MEQILNSVIETVFEKFSNENGKYKIFKTVVDEVIVENDEKKQVIDRKLLDKEWCEFCEHISKKNTDILIGSNESIDLRTFISRSKYKKNIENFIDDKEKRCFAILGQSGYGKTNLMYDYYNQFKKKYPSIFISLTSHSGKISEYLDKELLKFSTDFEGYNSNFFFSSYKNKIILVYLDGIDECENIGFLKDNITEILKNEVRLNVKFILSSRIQGEGVDIFKEHSLWSQFLLFNGHENIIKKELSDHSVSLTSLTSEEQKAFWNKYSTEYKVSIDENIDSDTISGLDIPYFISMACEVFENQQMKMNIKMKDLYEKWFFLKYSMFENHFESEVVLSKIAMLCLSNDEVVLKSTIKKNTELVDKYEIIEKFGRIGILKCGLNDRGETQWRFVNFRMMMYVIFFESLELNKKNFFEVVSELNKINKIDKALVLRGTAFYLTLMYADTKNPGSPNDIPFEKFNLAKENFKCPVCTDCLRKGDEMTYIYSFSSGTESDVFNKGAFYLIHKSCLKDITSILNLSDTITRSLNISDFISIELIGEILPKLIKQRDKDLDGLYKANNLEKFAVLSYKNSNGVENLHGQIINNKFCVLLYKNKSTAQKYIPGLKKQYSKKLQFWPEIRSKNVTKEIYMDIIKISNGDVLPINKFSSCVNSKPLNINVWNSRH